MKRAIRRHHKERLKEKRKTYWGFSSFPKNPVQLGVLIDTPKPCSCSMCCNPRRSGFSKGENLTMPERRFLCIKLDE